MPTDPHRLRVTKPTPVAALGGMSFEDPPLEARVNRLLGLLLSLVLAYEGQGKEMSFSKGPKNMTFQELDDIIVVLRNQDLPERLAG